MSTAPAPIPDVATLTPVAVAELEAATRADLAGAITNLAALREGGAHLVAGFDTWHDYVLDRFGDLLRLLRLTVAERRALVRSMAGSKADERPRQSARAIAAKLGVTHPVVLSDLRAVDDGDLPDNVVSLDAKRRVAVTGPRPAEAPRSLRAAILAALVERGPLTAGELRVAVRRPEGSSVAAALTALTAAGRVRYTAADRRGRPGVYALPG